MKKILFLMFVISLFLLNGCAEQDTFTETGEEIEVEEEIEEEKEISGEGMGCVGKWYNSGSEIRLKGVDGKEYSVVIGDITSSGMSDYEVALSLREEATFLIIDSDTFSANEEINFMSSGKKVLKNKMTVEQIKKYEVGAEPFKVLIETC